MNWSRWAAALLACLVLSGCVRREGRNSDCKWPDTQEGGKRAELRHDLEFAEELAIRYMDAHYGPKDMAAAAQAKNRCLGILLQAVGSAHGMSAEEAFWSFGQRSAAVDLAMHFPFLVLYLMVGDYAVRRLLKRYPLCESRTTTVMLILLSSVVFGIGAVVVGAQWSDLVESIRIGTTHLSNRSLRLPIHKLSSVVFVCAVALFLCIARLRVGGMYRKMGQ